MKFKIITFGCKVNQYESNVMEQKMLASDFFNVDDDTTADIIIVNTCTVTNNADHKCLKYIRSIKRRNPNCILVVCGCSVQNKIDVYKKLDIDILLGNKDKSKIASIIQNYLKDKKKYCKLYEDRNLEFEDMELTNYDHVRAFMKIEDGCDNFCSYCIIPYVRGSVRSKNFDKIIEEATLLAKTNHKEIVLTGIHTGHYNYNNHDLSDVIRSLAEINDLERIRVSSIEVTELSDKFLETLKSTPKLVDHLHIPLQSGSDTILKKMNRKYDTKYFYDKVNSIRKIRPDISITTDIIVGFPGETDELFEETMDFARKIKFAKIHVFPFSKREGTVAARMGNEVNGSIKKERVRRLLEVSSQLEDEYYNKFKGKELDILIEENVNGKSIGHTSNYLKVSLDENLTIGEIYRRQI